MRESAIERHLVRRVKAAGGECRKLKGRRNECDRLVVWPAGATGAASFHFVEVKAPGRRPRPGQAREHVRLQRIGCSVLVLDTKDKIEAYVNRWGFR